MHLKHIYTLHSIATRDIQMYIYILLLLLLLLLWEDYAMQIRRIESLFKIIHTYIYIYYREFLYR